MATQKFYVLKYKKQSPKEPDGQVKARDNGIIGAVWNREGPDGKYLSGALKDHWIITEEDYKEYKKLKKQHG